MDPHFAAQLLYVTEELLPQEVTVWLHTHPEQKISKLAFRGLLSLIGVKARQSLMLRRNSNAMECSS
jgi:hypothetical protein